MAQKFTVPITVKQLTSASSDAVTVYVDADTYARLKVEAGGRLVWGSGSATGDVTLYRESADILKTDDSFKVGGLFTVTASSGDEGGEINLAAPATNTAISGNVAIDIYQNKIRIFETGGSNRGAYIDLTSANTGVGSNLLTGSGGATTLDGLTDVTAPTPASGDFLKWNGTAWVNDPINLGTDTTGNYVSDVSAGTGISVSHTPGEGSTPSVSLNATLDNLSNVTVPSPTTNDVLQWNGTAWVNVAASSVGATNLDGLTDVVITTPEEFQTLEYNGTNWVNAYSSVVSYVRNAESTTLTTGTVVYLYGATGDHATVKRADKASDTTSSKTVGLVGANITASNNGPVVTRGYVDGIDLSVGYSPGDILWLGSNGEFTKTKAVAPDHLVFVGVVVRATNNGIVYVATQNGYELDELHNVSIPSPSPGEFLKYNGSLWVNDAINLGTDTVGNYMSDVSAGTGISVTHTPSEGSTGTVAIDTAVVPRLGVTNTFSTNQIISGSTTADLLRITQTGTGNALLVEDDTNPDSTPTVIDNAGRVIVGHTSTIPVAGNSGVFQVHAGAVHNAFLSRWVATASGAELRMAKSRSATVNSFSVVSAADVLGTINAYGDDGTAFTLAGAIDFRAEGTISTGVVPGRIAFYTANSSGTNTERMRIDSSGQIGIGITPNAGRNLEVRKSVTGATEAFSIFAGGNIQSDVTAGSTVFAANPAVAASVTVPLIYHFGARGVTLGSGAAATTVGGFVVGSNMIQGTNNRGFWGALASAANTYNLYMDGTAPNYLAGRLGVGATLTSGAMVGITNTTASDIALSVKGAASQSGVLISAQNSAGTSVFSVNSIGALDVASNIDGTSGYIQIGNARSANGNAYIDLIGDTTYTDYGLRVIRFAGSGAISRVEHRGLGDFQVYATEASPITFHTTATERMRIDPAGNVGIGAAPLATSSFRIAKNFTGGTTAYGTVSDGQIQSGVTSSFTNYYSGPSTQATAFTLGSLFHFRAETTVLGAGSSLTNHMGFSVGSSFPVTATLNAGFHGAIASGSGYYNLYMNGTADNYLSGNTGIGGLPVANTKLHVAGPTANTANPTIRLTGVSGSGNLNFFNDLSAGSYNNIVAAGSKGIIAAGANSTTSRASFVIAPWSDVAYGIRFEGGATTNIWNRGTTIFQPSETTSIASVMRGLASQTANLQEWQNSSSTVLAYVDSSGNAKFASIDGGSA